MSGEHSILPPSGAAKWRRCAMWPTMNRRFPKADTPETLEGNAAHWVAWEMYAGRHVEAGTFAPNGVVVTPEMIEGAELLYEVIAERINPGRAIVERRVSCNAVHEMCWGTPDVRAELTSNFVLEVIDYKYGHRFVDEYENDQCVVYTSGILDEIATQLNYPVGELDRVVTVNITIVQPRCFYKGKPVRTWSVRAVDLRAQINALSNAAREALGPNPRATPHPDTCRDCPGRAACPELQKAAYSDAQTGYACSPVELTPAAASLELKMLEAALGRLQSRVEGLREVVAAYARQGHATPWYRIEKTYGRQEWTIPPGQVIALGQLMGKDLQRVACCTPKQAAKIGIDETVITDYSITPSGAPKLVPDNPADARRVFGRTF